MYVMEEFEEEVFESVHGDYKTIIVCKFHKKGYLISHSIVTKSIIDEVMFSLKEGLAKAIADEDWKMAVHFQELINAKRTAEEEKPTL